MKSNIYTIKEAKNPTSTAGKGEKGLIIVINQLDMDQNIQTLQGLVKAIKLDIDNDVKILTIDEQTIDINTELKEKTVRTLILVGISPDQIGFSINAKKYFFYQMEQLAILLTDSLTIMNQDKSKKMQFWKNLQEKFLTP
jgi:hypothetical protein